MKQITYFDPRAKDPSHPEGREITVIAGNDEEYDAHMAAITNPERGIPQDSIAIEELPEPEAYDPLLDLDALAVDHEYRITLLELGVI